MNKIYKFLAVAMTVVCCLGFGGLKAQTIWSEDFSNIHGFGTNNTQCEAGSADLSDHAGELADSLGSTLTWSGSKVNPANGKIKLGTSSVMGFVEVSGITHPTASVMTFSFDARPWFKNNEVQDIVVTINGQEFPFTLTAAASAEDCTLQTYTVNFSAPVDQELTIRISASVAANNRFFVDNMQVIAANDPSISFTPATQGESFENMAVGDTRTINYIATGFNLGDGNTTVSFSGSTAFTSNAPATISNADLTNGQTIAITYAPTTPGNDAATITFTNSDLNLSFNIVGSCINGIATIAELRALMDCSNTTIDTTGTTTYLYTGHAIITEHTTNSTSWMQDETGAIQLYNQGGAFIANATVGTEVTNVVGNLANYYGYLELKPTAEITDINHFPTTVIEPQSITLGQLQDQEYMDGIQGQLVKLENVTFNQTGTFAGYTLYTVNQGEITDTAVYTSSNYDPIVGQSIPTTAKNVIGVNLRKAVTVYTPDTIRLVSRYYVLPREITEPTGIAENENSSVNVYPNPTNGNVTVELNETATNVAIYNMVGKLVRSQSISAGLNTVEMNGLTAGVYFLRIYNDNKIIGTAKVVRQ